MNEEKLINEIRGNPERFGIIYDQHFRTIFNYCFKRTGDFDSSKDMASETFLKAFVSINKFKWKGVSLLSWLYRIATNEINLHYRSKKYRPSLLSELGMVSSQLSELKSNELLKEKSSAQQELEKHEQFIKVQGALKKLPLKYQEVIGLKYFEEQKIKEISVVLKKPEGTVKSLLSRGMALLRKQL